MGPGSNADCPGLGYRWWNFPQTPRAELGARGYATEYLPVGVIRPRFRQDPRRRGAPALAPAFLLSAFGYLTRVSAAASGDCGESVGFVNC